MKVLVTGGSGFVGEAIIRELIENNFEVVALVNENSEFKIDPDFKKKCCIVRADIRNSESLYNLPFTEKIDFIIHSAGLAHQFGTRDEQDFWDVNVLGTKNISQLAVRHSVRHLVLISSVAVYGKSAEVENSDHREGLSEESECRPDGIYAVTKFESEKIAKQICEEYKINLTILRLATVIGENDRGNVFRLIKAIDSGRFVWIGDGRNLKSLIYKGDVARACLKVLKKKPSNRVFNLTADALTIQEIVSEIYFRLNLKKPQLKISPRYFKWFFQINRKTLNIQRINKISETIRKWLSDDIFSGEKFNNEYKFQAKTPVLEAIGREVDHYLKSK